MIVTRGLLGKRNHFFFFFQCKRLAHRGMKKESPDWPAWIREVLLFLLQHVTLKTRFVVTLVSKKKELQNFELQNFGFDSQPLSC